MFGMFAGISGGSTESYRKTDLIITDSFTYVLHIAWLRNVMAISLSLYAYVFIMAILSSGAFESQCRLVFFYRIL